MSTISVRVSSDRAAWDMIHRLAAPALRGLGVGVVGFAVDDGASRRAGYKVYRAVADSSDVLRADNEVCEDAADKLFYNYVSDLGDGYELNTCGADWSGDVYRITVDPSYTPAGSSAVAGADSAGSSESGAADPDLVTLRLRRSDVCRVSSALLGVKFDFIEEALPLQVDDPRRGVCIRSARAWDALRQEVRRQLQEHDARRGCGVDPWEVA